MSRFGSVFFLLVLIFTGCNKDHAVLNPAAVLKVKRLSESLLDYGSNSSSTQYQYNRLGRLSSFENAGFTYYYSYRGNKIIYTITRLADSYKLYELTLQLNKEGVMTGGEGTMYYITNNPISFKTAYEYNEEGFLVKQTTIQNSTRILTKEFSYSNGDLTALKYSDNGKLKYTVTYSYANNTVNKLNVLLFADFPVPANGFSGKTSLHLWSKAEQVNTDGLKGNNIKEYILDADGYPVSCKNTGNNISFNEKFSYTLNN